jgi:hypothetical protein
MYSDAVSLGVFLRKIEKRCRFATMRTRLIDSQSLRNLQLGEPFEVIEPQNARLFIGDSSEQNLDVFLEKLVMVVPILPVDRIGHSLADELVSKRLDESLF